MEQADWAYPVCSDWVQALDDAITQVPQPPIVVAHSLGCLVAVHWASRSLQPVHALVLGAVPDPMGSKFPADAQGFAPMPTTLTPPGEPTRQAMLVSSANDPYSSPAFTARCATLWAAEHRELGPLGHINAESGLDDWPQGWALVQRWLSA